MGSKKGLKRFFWLAERAKTEDRKSWHIFFHISTGKLASWENKDSAHGYFPRKLSRLTLYMNISSGIAASRRPEETFLCWRHQAKVDELAWTLSDFVLLEEDSTGPFPNLPAYETFSAHLAILHSILHIEVNLKPLKIKLLQISTTRRRLCLFSTSTLECPNSFPFLEGMKKFTVSWTHRLDILETRKEGEKSD